MKSTAIWTAVFICVMPLVEYVSHRWVLHHPTFGKRGSSYQDHHVDHHHRGMNESIHLDVFPLQWNNLLPVTLMLIVVALVGGPVACLTWLACLSLYGQVWGQIHRAAHDMRAEWIAKTWYGRAAIRHHLVHHQRPYTNYGTVFFFTDHIFRTYGGTG